MSDHQDLLANENITAESVRLVHNDIGFNQVMSLADALVIANNEGLDLVQVSDQDVPVVKLLDVHKYKFDQQQKARAQRKSQRVTAVKTKEVQLSLEIQENDLQTKVKQANKFLAKGHNIKISLRLHGRARSNIDMRNLALEKVHVFTNALSNHEVVSAPSGEDTIISTVKPV